jgi:GntR family transcriptional regulator
MDERLSKQPLYCQVANVLVERIARGIWKPGTSIPNEVDLAREMGVSTGTMRKALNRLESNHLIVRQQGRGTYVEDQTKLNHLQRFDPLRHASGIAITSIGKVIAQEFGPATEIERVQLSLEADETVLRTTRIRTHMGRPYIYETAVIAASRFPGLNGDTGDYVLAALGQKHGVILGQAVEQLTLCESTKEVASALDVAAGAILVKLDRIISAFASEPLEWRIGFCPLRDEKYVVTIA